jgi:hypothetical protein
MLRRRSLLPQRAASDVGRAQRCIPRRHRASILAAALFAAVR